MDPEENNAVKTRSSMGSINVASRLTGLQLIVVARSYTHNFCVLSLVVVTFIPYIVLVRFLEISYHIPSMTSRVMEAYEGDHLSSIPLHEINHVTQTSGICVINLFFCQLGWSHGSMV